MAILMVLALTACGNVKTTATSSQSATTSGISEQNKKSTTAFDTDQIKAIKQQLGIPDDLKTEDKIYDDNPNYWEATEIWTVTCEFYHDGQLILSSIASRKMQYS